MLPCSVCRNRKLVFRKLWQSGDCTYGCGVLGVTPDRDVTWQVMTTANAGRSVGTGMVTGAWERQPQVFQIQQTGSVVQVDSSPGGEAVVGAKASTCWRVFQFARQGSRDPFGRKGGSFRRFRRRKD